MKLILLSWEIVKAYTYLTMPAKGPKLGDSQSGSLNTSLIFSNHMELIKVPIDPNMR